MFVFLCNLFLFYPLLFFSFWYEVTYIQALGLQTHCCYRLSMTVLIVSCVSVKTMLLYTALTQCIIPQKHSSGTVMENSVFTSQFLYYKKDSIYSKTALHYLIRCSPRKIVLPSHTTPGLFLSLLLFI